MILRLSKSSCALRDSDSQIFPDGSATWRHLFAQTTLLASGINTKEQRFKGGIGALEAMRSGRRVGFSPH
jgi:hypothetical protein